MAHRRADVLHAIVSDYVTTGEPVGSKALVDQHKLGVSPATIRNDMAALEKAGYIYQPHTSAGRIPTDKGYRAFVDQIATIKPLSAGERRAIERFLGDAVSLDDVVDRTVRLLSQLTNQVALVQYPSFTRACLRHIEIVGIGGTQMLLVVITDSGRVEQRVIDAGTELTEVQIVRLRSSLNARLAGLTAEQITGTLTELTVDEDASIKLALAAIVKTLSEIVAPEVSERIVMAGTANLVRSNPTFISSLAPVLETLEEQVALLRLFSEAGEDHLAVSIGTENHHDGLNQVSVVTGAYGIDDDVVAHLGVVGPTRMDYPGTMAAVRAVARYLSRFLQGGSQ